MPPWNHVSVRCCRHRCCRHTFCFRSITWRDALISFKVCRSLYHCKLQFKFDIGNHLPNFGWVMALFRLSFYCRVKILVSIQCSEGMHLFQKFADGYIIVKSRSSLMLVTIRKILAEFWPFFDLVFSFFLLGYVHTCIFVHSITLLPL